MARLLGYNICVLVLLCSISNVRSGFDCTTDADCTSRGLCRNTGDCLCHQLYSGSNCQHDCSMDSHCNGGTCTTSDNPKRCLCPENKFGHQCEYDQLCVNDGDCENGGTCNKEASANMCDCRENYTGTTCETALMVESSSNVVLPQAMVSSLMLLMLSV